MRSLECFVAVAEEGHIAPAAARLGIGQSRLNRTVALLERSLCVELLRHDLRAVELTAPGMAVMRLGQAVLAEHDVRLKEIAWSVGAVHTRRPTPARPTRLLPAPMAKSRRFTTVARAAPEPRYGLIVP
jgi:DNA-binding transcriptional LysR family regulator